MATVGVKGLSTSHCRPHTDTQIVFISPIIFTRRFLYFLAISPSICQPHSIYKFHTKTVNE